MPTYAEQILISTGRDDWSSKIEDEPEGEVVREVKKLLGRGGKMSDPYHNVMITNSSFAPTASDTGPGSSAFLFPSFQYIPEIPTSTAKLESFLRGFVLPKKLHSAHSVLSPDPQQNLIRQPELQTQFPAVRPVDEILVLICGHGSRDSRCGTLGPLLRDEFCDQLATHTIPVLSVPPPASSPDLSTPPPARVGLISHIGGHKFAGNVIIYIPPSMKDHALAGKGIWYGRVGPEHVEGIVRETIVGGKVIQELFRGGIGKGAEVMRL
ncbi:Altered inheritance of mitochondria protein 32 [Oleoguttula sp. CCFEE 5521]